MAQAFDRFVAARVAGVRVVEADDLQPFVAKRDHRVLIGQHLDACTLRCADDVALRIEMEGPETVAAVFMEPVQNTGGAFVPPDGYFERVREICDRYGVLFVSDEVIAATPVTLNAPIEVPW